MNILRYFLSSKFSILGKNSRANSNFLKPRITYEEKQERSNCRKYPRLDTGDRRVTHNDQHEQAKDPNKLQLDTDKAAGEEHSISCSCSVCKILYFKFSSYLFHAFHVNENFHTYGQERLFLFRVFSLFLRWTLALYESNPFLVKNIFLLFDVLNYLSTCLSRSRNFTKPNFFRGTVGGESFLITKF